MWLMISPLGLKPVSYTHLDVYKRQVQALGVFIDTIVICSCTAMIMLLVPEELTTGLAGMDLLQKVMSYYMGEFGVVFIAVTLALFSFSTFLGILFYARSNVAYLFGNLSLIHI